MKLRDILLTLKFEQDWTAMTDEQPGYLYRFGNLDLEAVQVMDWYLRPMFQFGGVVRNERPISEISFQMPLEVDSFEQGIAWIANGLGTDFRPIIPAPWIEEGRRWAGTLPWAEERRRHEARPQCQVDSEWFRVAVKKLREHAEAGEAAGLASFEFDGNVLLIKTKGEFVAMPAQGSAWDRPYFLQTAKLLDSLPKRIRSGLLAISIWDARLTIDRRTFQLVDPDSQR